MQNTTSVNAHVLGLKLENEVLTSMKALGVFDAIYHERDLVQKFGWQCCSIDVLAVCGDFIVPTQQKWRNSKRRETQGVDNFIKSIEYVERKLGKKILFGVWSSRMKPFDDNVMKLQERNVVCVSHSTDIDTLVEKTIDIVKKEINKKKNVCV